MANILAGLYYEFSIPLGLVNIVRNVIAALEGDPNTPQVSTQRAPREWFSQPRPASDQTVEVIQVNFKVPLSISSLSFKVLRLPCTVTAWYRDRNNNWIPLTDSVANPISVKMSYSAAATWYTYTTETYEVVATAVQLRVQRNADAQVGNNPYVVGIKETLIKREVYSASQTTAAIADQEDELGNTITSYVKHWGASNMLDNDPGTFWRSFPAPDPAAVVSAFFDSRTPDGSPQLVDTVYIDPVHAGQNLNLYYSNDPTNGTLIISPVNLPPDTQENANWTSGVGMADTSALNGVSELLFPVSFGPLVSDPLWIGIEWTPDFDPASPPSSNPILFSTTPTDPTAAATAGQFWPQIYYDVGAGEVTLEFTNGTTTHNFGCALSPTFTTGVPLQIVVGWAYDPNVVFMSVTQKNTTVLGTVTTSPATTLPKLITLDGETGYNHFRGLMTALVIKAEPWTAGATAFTANPTVYANPAPVQPDSQGNYPSTSLDNAILAVDWTTQQFPIGGSDQSWYANKTWTPIFGNYVTQKGNLFLPQKVSMSWLKMEFTNLTAEPYPIYDQGVSVTYDTFPVSVIQQSTTTGIISGGSGILGAVTGLLTLGADIITGSIGSVNWLNPSSIQNAINAAFGQTTQSIYVNTGPGTIVTTMPNAAQAAITTSARTEASSPWIYKRQVPNAAYLTGQNLATIAGTGNSTQTLAAATDSSTSAVASNFTPVVTTSTSNILPKKGKDWWLFPGGTLKMPAQIMTALFGTAVKTGRYSSTATRVRFTNTSVHKYVTKTVTLDAAVAYFAGLAEVQTYVTSYIASNDPQSFDYSQYDPVTFHYTNIDQFATGPISTAGTPYVLENPDFLSPLGLTPWTPTGNWYWDSQHGVGSENGQGDESCAAIVADGGDNTLISEFVTVQPGDEITITAMVAYYNALSNVDGDDVDAGTLDEVVTDNIDSEGASPGDRIDGADIGLLDSNTSGLSLSGVVYLDGVRQNTVNFAMPATAATHTVSDRDSMLALTGLTPEVSSCTITGTEDQGTYLLQASPATNFSNWLLTGYGTVVSEPTGNIDGRLFITLTGTYTVPGSGVDGLAISLNVGAGVVDGNIYWGRVRINPTAGIEGIASFNAVTFGQFSDVSLDFRDSGLITSDALWAQADPTDTNIANLTLAPYVNTIPSFVPSGTWADTFAEWGDPSIEWGEAENDVAINVDPNLIYQGNRAMHFTRAAGAGSAGILLTQQTNMLPKCLAQLGCIFLKPTANDNQITIRLRRVSDGVYIYSETFTPVVGFWYTYQTQFFELPDTPDQVYTLEMVATGDAADELYLSNLYTNVAGVRYFFQIGDDSTFLFDVTPLAYGGGNTNVSATLPVTEFTLTTGIFSPDAYAYGVAITPHYLK